MKPLAYLLGWAAGALLVGCTAAGAATERLTLTYCDGDEHTLPVTTIRSPDPWLDCVNMARDLGATQWQVASLIVGMPLACALFDHGRTWAVLVLPLWAPAWMAEHELAHVRGETHLSLLPGGCPHA